MNHWVIARLTSALRQIGLLCISRANLHEGHDSASSMKRATVLTIGVGMGFPTADFLWLAIVVWCAYLGVLGKVLLLASLA